MLSQPTSLTHYHTVRRCHLPRRVSACAAIDHLLGVYLVPAPAWLRHGPVCWPSAPQLPTTTLVCLRGCDASSPSLSYRHRSLLAPLFRGLDRLAIQDSSTRRLFSARLHSQLCTQRVVDALPHTRGSPLSEVPVDYLPGWQVSGHHPPGVATSQQVEYGVGYLSKLVLALTSCMLGWWQQRLKQCPLLICEVARIWWVSWSFHVHTSSLPHPPPSCQCC
jgi:hypothetical protein